MLTIAVFTVSFKVFIKSFMLTMTSGVFAFCCITPDRPLAMLTFTKPYLSYIKLSSRPKAISVFLFLGRETVLSNQFFLFVNKPADSSSFPPFVSSCLRSYKHRSLPVTTTSAPNQGTATPSTGDGVRTAALPSQLTQTHRLNGFLPRILSGPPEENLGP